MTGISCSPHGLSAGVVPASSPSKTQCPHGAGGLSQDSCPSKQDTEMTCFQRIFHVHTKRQIFLLTQKADFPICLEVAFGPQPRESQGARRHSDECPHQPSCSPAREEGPPLRICRGRRPQTARLGSRPPAASSRLWGWRGSESSHLLPWPQATPAPHRQGLRCQPHIASRAGLWWSVCVC